MSTIARDLPDYPTILARLERRLERVERSWLRAPIAQDWTPALTAVTTDPTLGTGSLVEGDFIQRGDWVEAGVRILFGTSGTAAGSGVYRVSLPINALAAYGNNAAVGSGFLLDSDTNTQYVVAVKLDGTDRTRVRIVPNASGSASNTVPFAWGANDTINLVYSYRVARLAVT